MILLATFNPCDSIVPATFCWNTRSRSVPPIGNQIRRVHHRARTTLRAAGRSGVFFSFVRWSPRGTENTKIVLASDGGIR